MLDLTKGVTRWPIKLKIRRGLWTYLIEPLVRWLPKSFSFVRVFALKSMGAEIGPRCLILPGVRVLMPWNLRLDGYVAIGEGVNIYNFAPVHIGRMTVISQNTYLCTGSHDYAADSMPLIFSPISIGSNCWVAAGTFILPGVSVAEGVVIGAMSVVSKGILRPWTVWAGNPAIFLKNRILIKKDE